jgi:hypothetical protein
MFTNTANSSGVNDTGLDNPAGVVVDSNGNVFVSDTGNNRVVEYLFSIDSGAAATNEFGQTSFSGYQPNQGHPSPSEKTLSGPAGLAVDGLDRVTVADTGNNRVLRLSAQSFAAGPADELFGQSRFDNYGTNSGGLNGGLNGPVSVAIDPGGDTFIADRAITGCWNMTPVLRPPPTWSLGSQMH